jgi:hypothetical protein
VCLLGHCMSSAQLALTRWAGEIGIGINRQGNTGTETQRYRDTEVQRHRGTETKMDSDTEGQRDREINTDSRRLESLRCFETGQVGRHHSIEIVCSESVHRVQRSSRQINLQTRSWEGLSITIQKLCVTKNRLPLPRAASLPKKDCTSLPRGRRHGLKIRAKMGGILTDEVQLGRLDVARPRSELYARQSRTRK